LSGRTLVGSAWLIVKMASAVVEVGQLKVAASGKDNSCSMNVLVDKMDSVNMNEVVSPEDLIKHPLQNAWTLWFFKNDKACSWEENQRPIITVKTVEDFWSLYNHITGASKLPPGSDYSLFKEGIFPDWEDPMNKLGGRWVINLDKKMRVECLDTYWLEIMLYLIGEQADQHSHQVNGAVVNVRAKGDKLGVWLADASNAESVVRIGKMIKDMLGTDALQTIGFTAHKDVKVRPGNSAKKFFL